MARVKSKSKSKNRNRNPNTKTSSNPFSSDAAPQAQPEPEESIESLIQIATELLRTDCSPSAALSAITRALELSPTSLPAIELAGEINVELGDIPTARKYFQKAVSLDPEGLHEDAGGSGPEKFLWLAQLCETGGKEAVGWFERGVKVLRSWIQEVDRIGGSKDAEMLEERGLKGKLCSALCGMAEIYMTDLCMEPDAESNCERFVTEALLAVPDSAEALQTLASVRISQTRMNEAQAALERSVAIWKDLEPGSPNIPPYATRMAITRLLMETELYDLAFEVLEGLQEEDDQVVDLWYLGGWCLYCKGEKVREEEEQSAKGKGKGKEKLKNVNMKGNGGGGEEEDEEDTDDDWETLWAVAREWLNNCAQLYQALEWEDDRLRDHAIELLGNINEALGEEMDDEDGDDGDDDNGEGEWEDADSDEDEEMKD